uniref:DNA/RNA non-specific endonuclease domain-containing protein n=1 Tax=Strigamia maritima TaxID=126957 RepID=T1J7A4_STRMM
MAQFRLLCSIAAILGYTYASPIEKRRNFFKLHAEIPEELQQMRLRNPDRVEEITKYGMPQRDVVLKFKDFELSYDNRTRVANYVVEHLDCKRHKFHYIPPPIMEDNDSFSRDHRVQYASIPFDYFQSGFVKCHLAEKRNHSDSMDYLKGTYASTNIAPQNSELNCRGWSDLEFYARRMLWHYNDIYIFTGPLYCSKQNQMKYQVIGMNNVAVPTHFFKVIVGVLDCSLDLIVGCYIMPNEPIPDHVPLGYYRASWSDVQEKSGLTFLTGSDRPYNEDLPDIVEFRDTKRFFECFVQQPATKGPGWKLKE